MNIKERIFSLQDLSYKKFNGSLVPDVELIGVRIPILRKLAKGLSKNNKKEVDIFLADLPHRYIEENHLHAFLLEEEKDIDELIEKADIFLSFVDNWQTCDSFLPKAFKKDDEKILNSIDIWLNSDEEFKTRYAIRLMLFRRDFTEEDILKVIKAGRSDYYYVHMAAAWYLSMVAKNNREDFIKYLNKDDMDERIISLTLKKIRESKQFSRAEKEEFSFLIDK